MKAELAMHALLEPGLADSLGGIWAALHKDVDIRISDSEVHYLRAVALMLDDDATSALLLRKLKLAACVEDRRMPPATVRMNSFLEYSFDHGPRRFCQLVHDSEHAPAYGLRVTDRLGAGVIGLRSGQIILWPDDEGRLCELAVLQVENCPGITEWIGADGA